ncbi:MAG: nodulation protein NfeD [Ignavibacteria bacterium]|nr:nodulation protein NfeD [Ignavibacteria bacterium]
MIIIFFIACNLLFAEEKKVYVINITSEVDLGLAPYVERVIDEAHQAGADAIILKINTFGGRVDAAARIKDAIVKSSILTVAFINNRAISAGSLIAISCKKIVMAPGSTIGATTVVDQMGTKASEKFQSYMRSEMRSTAERNGRRTDIAEAMVDERIVLKDHPELDDSTKLLTLTTDEALKLGYCDFTTDRIDSILKFIKLNGAKLIYTSSNWAEEVVKFLTNPIISSLLIMIGLIGLITEIKTPGWGLPGTAGLIAITLFFGANYILELANIWEILLFFVGLILLFIEIFFIPGFGITGIAGIILIVASIFFGLLGNLPTIEADDVSRAILQLTSSLVLGGIFIYFSWKFLPKTSTFKKLILSVGEQTKEGFASSSDLSYLVGKEGKSITILRPAGSALIDGKRIDVVTEGEFISPNTEIKVLRVEGSKVVVGLKT